MTRTQKRKFTMALNGLLAAKGRFHYSVGRASMQPGVGKTSHKKLLDYAETKRAHLYRVVDELVGK